MKITESNLNSIPRERRNVPHRDLVFDNPQDNGKVERGKDQILDFVAQQVGTYEFKCAKLCAMHHGRMKGKLIVEE